MPRNTEDAPQADLDFKVTEAEKEAFKALCEKHQIEEADGFRAAAQLLKTTKAMAPDVDTEVFITLLAGVDEFTLDREYEVSIARRGFGDAKNWAVSVMGATVLTRDGERVYEPSPSGRDEAFIEATRFTFGEAVTMAKDYMAQVLEGRMDVQP